MGIYYCLLAIDYCANLTVSTSISVSFINSLSTSPEIRIVVSGVAVIPFQSSLSISTMTVPVASLNKYFSPPKDFSIFPFN